METLAEPFLNDSVCMRPRQSRTLWNTPPGVINSGKFMAKTKNSLRQNNADKIYLRLHSVN